MTRGMNLPLRKASVSAAFAVALTLTFASALHAQAVLEYTPVLGMPQYYPIIHFDYSTQSNVSYDPVAQLLRVDGTPTFLDLGASFPHYPIVGTSQMVGNTGPFIFGTTTIQVTVDNLGVLHPANHDACGDGTPADFCITGSEHDLAGNVIVPQGVLLRGTVRTFASTRTHPLTFDVGNGPQPWDFFEYQAQLTGGSLITSFSNVSLLTGGSIVAFDVASPKQWFYTDSTTGLPVTYNATTFTGTFTTLFKGTNIIGSVGATDNVSLFVPPPPDNCNGTIGGHVVNTLTTAPIFDVSITLSSLAHLTLPLKTTTAADGSYSFPNLCAGTDYQVEAPAPSGYTTDGATKLGPLTLTEDAMNNDSSSLTNNFSFYTVGLVSSSYATYTQAAWGAKPKGHNAGYLLATFYVIPYGTGPVVIGGAKTVMMTGSDPIEDFLPQSGRAAPLNNNYVDPVVTIGQHKPHNKLGSLAGEMLALRLNVDFSASSLTRLGLGSLHLASGPLAGSTVNQVLALGNCVLGGTPLLTCGAAAGLTYDGIEDVIEKINRNYEGGTTDRHYLMP